MKAGKKIKAAVAGICAVAVAGTGISVWAYQSKGSNDTETVYKETTVESGNLTVGVTESGSVTIGTLTQEIDFDETTSSSNSNNSSASSAGSTTGTGGNSAGSAAGAGSSSDANSSSGASSSSGSGSSSGSSSSASLEVEEVYVTVGQNVSEGDPLLKITDESVEEYRQVLEAAVSTASASLTSAKLSAAEQKLDAQYTYDSNVAEGTVAQAEYEATLAELQEAVDDAQEAVDESAAKIADYQARIAAGEDLSSELSEEQSNYNSLVIKLQSAQNNQTTKSIEAEKIYEETMLNYNNASSLYSVDVNGITDDVEDAQDALDDAKEALDEFESFIGDGTIYAEYSGSILSVGYEAGDDLSSDTAVAEFADADAVTMTVSVSQEDISNVAIGDAVNIELTAYEDVIYDGTVESIDTSTSSGSSTVSYNVTVIFTGDTSDVYSDMTGNVTFITKQVEDVLYVSNKAIIKDGTTSYVDVKDDDGTIEKVEVTTGFSDGINVEIQSVLEEGQTVLIESQVTSE